MVLTHARLAAGLTVIVAAIAGCGAASATPSSPTTHEAVPAATHTMTPSQAPQTPAPPRRHHHHHLAVSPTAAPPVNPIPQGNGGDQDADNNGGPSDGDGNI